MTSELDHLISSAHAAVREEEAAWIRTKHQEAATQIREEIERLNDALTTHLGDAIVHALYQADGAIEVWMHTFNDYTVFTPEAWEHERFPKIFVVFAFTYRGSRLHLAYLSSRRSGAFDSADQWELLLVRPVTPNSEKQRIFYSERRAMLANDRQRLLLMIDGLARANNEPA